VFFPRRSVTDDATLRLRLRLRNEVSQSRQLKSDARSCRAQMHGLPLSRVVTFAHMLGRITVCDHSLPGPGKGSIRTMAQLSAKIPVFGHSPAATASWIPGQ